MKESVNYFLGYQQRWIVDDADVALAEKSRRIGLTYAEAYRSVERRVRLGTNHYFASRDKETAREFITYCKMYAEVFQVVAEDLGEQLLDARNDVTAYVLRIGDGIIFALSSNPDAFRGRGGDVTLDEFAFHADKRALLKAAIASALVWGHQLRIISTHNGVGNVFNQLIEEIKRDKRDWSLHTTTIHDAVDEGLYELIQSLKAKTETEQRQIRDTPDPDGRQAFIDQLRANCTTEEEWEEEFCCNPSSDEGAYLNYELIRSCEAPDLKLYQSIGQLPSGRVYLAGVDVGRHKDLFVLWVWEKIGDIYWLRAMIVLQNQSFAVMKGVLRQAMRRPDFRRMCIDKNGIGEQLAEEMAYEFRGRVEPVALTNTSKSTMGARFRQGFLDRVYRIPEDEDLREDLHKVRKTVTATGQTRLVATSDSSGHADRFWAGALATEADDHTNGPLPQPLRRKPPGW